MFPHLNQIDRRTRKTNDFLNDGFSPLGVSKEVLPTSYPNLNNWFKPSGISCPAGNFNDWVDEVQIGEKFTGSICTSGSTCNCIGSFFGYDYLSADGTSVVMSYTTPSKANLSTLTMFFVISSNAINNSLCLNSKSLVGSSILAIRQATTGKLEFFTRTDNGETAIVASVNNFNGAGFKVVVVSYDLVSKKATMYEGGNTISVTNILMDTFLLDAFELNEHGTQYWTGGFLEMFQYSDIKNIAQINSLANYLASKYGLNWIDVL